MFKRTNVQLEDISFENPQIPCEPQKLAANQRFKIKSVATTSNNLIPCKVLILAPNAANMLQTRDSRSDFNKACAQPDIVSGRGRDSLYPLSTSRSLLPRSHRCSSYNLLPSVLVGIHSLMSLNSRQIPIDFHRLSYFLG